MTLQRSDPAESLTRRALPGRSAEAWLTLLLFVGLASALLAFLLEWPHYRNVVERGGASQSGADRLILAWVVWAKTQLPLVPVILLAWGFAATGWQRATWPPLIVAVCATFAWILIDLSVQWTFGTNALTWLPFVWNAVREIGTADHFQWAGEWQELAFSILAVLGKAALAAVGVLAVSSLAARLLVRRLQLFATRRATLALIALHATAVVAAIPAQTALESRTGLRRLHSALPIPAGRDLAEGFRRALFDTGDTSAVSIVGVAPMPRKNSVERGVLLYNASPSPVSIDGWHLRDSLAQNSLALSGTIDAAQSLRIPVPFRSLRLRPTGDRVALVDPYGAVRHEVEYQETDVESGGMVLFQAETALDGYLDRISQGAGAVYARSFPELAVSRPFDAAVELGDPSVNVILVVLDSFRASALNAASMPRLHRWSERGLRLDRHYAATNVSALGTFTLLYGRSPVVYEPTLEDAIPPQSTASLRSAGYQARFLSSVPFERWQQMGRFINETTFDEVTFIPNDKRRYEGWPSRDIAALELVRQRIESADRPQFVVAFLISLHYPYAFPPEREKYGPAALSSNLRWSAEELEQLRNRYKNAAAFMDDEVSNLIDSLDPERNLVIVTGDHGESLFEDGAIGHSSRASEYQTRVPLVMVGPGVEPQVIRSATSHEDVVPTLLHAVARRPMTIAGAHGRDLLAAVPTTDQVLLRPSSLSEPGELVLVRGQQRLAFQYRSDRPEIEAIGFIDEAGQPEWRLQYQETSPVVWIEAFRAEMQRLTAGPR
jgi:hypothetical protein